MRLPIVEENNYIDSAISLVRNSASYLLKNMSGLMFFSSTNQDNLANVEDKDIENPNDVIIEFS